MSITTSLADGILAITIDRPDKKNAMTAAMYAAIAEALAAGGRDPAVKVFLVQGGPGAFSAGNDLTDFLQHPPQSFDDPVFRFLQELRTAEKPLVAAVTGVAVGIGTTMLLHCDLVFAADNAKFALPFVNLSICPEAASSFLLPLAAGYQRASELLLLGEPFDVATAREVGLVNKVLPAAEVAPAALAAAQKLAARPSSAVRTTKRLMRGWQAEMVKKAMEEEGRTFVAMLSSPEAKEAFSAFLEKRKPDFSKFG
jgi:enoyl-CoA hydratase/carnithine racemase